MTTTHALQFRHTSPHASAADRYVSIIAEVDTLEQAQEILATLPKALGLKAQKYYTHDPETGAQVVKGCLTGQVDLKPTKGNEVNETGVKRLARWKKELGIS